MMESWLNIALSVQTNVYFHKSIETGVATIKDFGKTHNFVVEHTEDSTHFSTAFLPQYDAIVFLTAAYFP